MKKIIKYFLSNVKSSKESLEQKSVLVDKPWALIDDNGEIQKLIFTKDNRLILSRNGVVSTGSWEYFPAGKALLIDRVTDKILLKEQYIDENVMLLRRDGTQDDYYAFANENSIPDLDVPKYLNSAYYRQNNIEEIKLIGGKSLLIPSETRFYSLPGSKAKILSELNEIIDAPDGKYFTENMLSTLLIKDGIIQESLRNEIIKTLDNNQLEIAGGHIYYKENVNKPVTMNGKEVPDGVYYVKPNVFFEVQGNIISKLRYLKIHFFSKGYKVQVQQQYFHTILKGDIIIQSEPIFPIPDGKYRLKGKLKWVKIKNNQVV